MSNSYLENLLTSWKNASTNLKWGVNKAFKDVLTLAAEGKTTLVYGSDYRNGYPCLVNTVGTMITTGGGRGIPSEHFGEVVGLFDTINREFEKSGINPTPGYVSPLAADFLIHNWSDVAQPPSVTEDIINAPYVEPSDEDFATMIRSAFESTAPVKFNIEKHEAESPKR